MPNQLGRRYTCEACGTEVLCTKGGTGEVACHEAPLALVLPKPMPTSD